MIANLRIVDTEQGNSEYIVDIDFRVVVGIVKHYMNSTSSMREAIRTRIENQSTDEHDIEFIMVASVESMGSQIVITKGNADIIHVVCVIEYDSGESYRDYSELIRDRVEK